MIDMDESTWDSIVELNLKSTFLCCQAAARAMRHSGGSIVNVTSAAARMPIPGMSHYGAAKAGLENMTTAMAIECGHLESASTPCSPA
jgi:3-oxoacyl-[acyl-carrier protein] reductase